jgi:hypothetical protein
MRVPTANVRRTKMCCATATTPVTASSPAEVDTASPATPPPPPLGPRLPPPAANVTSAVLTATASVLTLASSPKRTSLTTIFFLIRFKPKALITTLLAIMTFSFPKKAFSVAHRQRDSDPPVPPPPGL